MRGKAAIQNPYLESLSVLVGEWETVGSHPLMPGVTIRGYAVFEWIESGAYLRMYSEVDHPKVPNGIALFGSDDEAKKITMLYFDERKVSRHYEFSINKNGWKWWRDHPGFSQRFTVSIEDGGDTMVGKGEICKDGTTWEGDLDLTYSRLAT